MKKYSYHKINPRMEDDMKYLPQPDNRDMVSERLAFADMLEDAHPEHGAQYYLERMVAGVLEGVASCVCCLVNSNDDIAAEGRTSYNVLAPDGRDYLYVAKDGTLMIANVCDGGEDTFRRVHKLNY